ncbi:S4 domain-containing protein [Flavobacteriales bacterium]|jgi:23S rRNA pseudouridine2605 synthase|nr:S4 domain-containing protein [Flavobacteriales bacterium]
MKREGKSRKDFNTKPTKKSSFRKKQKAKKRVEDGMMRLNKFIANAGICSRREADKFIEAGVVSVNGVGITEMGHRVCFTDVVKFNGQKLKSETPRYVLLNKPKNYSGRFESGTTTSSVMQLIAAACKERIYPIDKLNKSETGLLLFTNDSDLAKKLTDKSQKLKAIYQITLNKNLTQTDLEKIREGFLVHGKTCSFDSISYIQNKDKNEIGIEHSRGGTKYVKNIFEKFNYQIIKLDRVFFGGLTKKDLPRKHYRHLTQDELNILKRL